MRRSFTECVGLWPRHKRRSFHAPSNAKRMRTIERELDEEWSRLFGDEKDEPAPKPKSKPRLKSKWMRLR